jgi:hypothetical protein
MELMEPLEPLIVLRNQQVAGSIPAGGSDKIKDLRGGNPRLVLRAVLFRASEWAAYVVVLRDIRGEGA